MPCTPRAWPLGSQVWPASSPPPTPAVEVDGEQAAHLLTVSSVQMECTWVPNMTDVKMRKSSPSKHRRMRRITVVGGEKELHSEREGTRGAQGCPSPPPGLLSGFEAMAGAVLSHTWPYQLSLRKALLSRLDLAGFPSLTYTTPCSPSLFPDSTGVCILVPSTVPSTVWKDQKDSELRHEGLMTPQGDPPLLREQNAGCTGRGASVQAWFGRGFSGHSYASTCSRVRGKARSGGSLSGCGIYSSAGGSLSAGAWPDPVSPTGKARSWEHLRP